MRKKINFNKFDKVEKKIKDTEDSVEDLSKEPLDEKSKDLIIHAALNIEKAEAEVEEADEESF